MAVQAGGAVGVKDALPVGPVGGRAGNRRVAAERTARQPLRRSTRTAVGASRSETAIPGRGELGLRAVARGGGPWLAGARLVILPFRKRAGVAAGVFVEHRRARHRRFGRRPTGGFGSVTVTRFVGRFRANSRQRPRLAPGAGPAAGPTGSRSLRTPATPGGSRSTRLAPARTNSRFGARRMAAGQ